MLIPAWHIALLLTVYAAEYFYRYFRIDNKKFISLGKALSRSVMAGVYFYVAFYNPPLAEVQVLVRWSLWLFLVIDLTFVLQEHLMRKYIP